jgi:hypothetical protein
MQSWPDPPAALPTVDGPSWAVPSLARAATQRHPKPGPATTVPEHGVQVPAYRLPADQPGRYRDVVASTAAAPMLLPALVATALHRDLLSGGRIPLPAFGMVHVASVVEATGTLPSDQPWQVQAWAAGTRHVAAGVEFDLWAQCVAGSARWQARVVTLSRSRRAAGSEPSAAPALPEAAALTEQEVLPAAESIGRAYARVSGDVNPIHLHAFTARPFGFSRAIAHGWWLAARVLALTTLDDVPAGVTRRLEIAFRRPVMLPSRPLLRFGNPAAADVPFALLDAADASRVLLGGRVLSGA